MITKVDAKLEQSLREELADVCHMAYARGLLSGTEGNFSSKITNDFILVTPKNSHKGLIKPSEFLIVDINGSNISNGKSQPTSELALHLEVYRRRPDVNAVVHAHPVSAVSFSVAGLGFSIPAIPEIIVLLGEVPTAPYAEPGTEKLAKIIGPYIEKHDAVILDHHGVVTIGTNILNAYCKLESLEHAAKILHSAKLLGDIKQLNKDDVQDLLEQRLKIYNK